MRAFGVRHLVAVVLVGLLALSFSAPAFAQERKPVTIEGMTSTYLRVLTRAFAKIYKEPKEGAQVVMDNVPTFQPFFVYTRPEVAIATTSQEGWYEVGKDDKGNVLGWMQAKDVMEWKYTLCLQFMHPEGRKPVLMFDNLAALQKVAGAEQAVREKEVDGFLKAIKEAGANGKKLPADFPIVSMEPEKAVDVGTQFYLMPILEAGEAEMEGIESRLLKIAAATTGRGETNIRTNEEFRSMALEGGEENGDLAEDPKLKNMKIDVVYVMDMTNSMGPYIRDTLSTIQDMANLLSQKMGGAASDLGSNISFGLWGYRDSAENIPGMEFTTKNFTPALQTVQEFESTLSQVAPAKAGSQGYEEDVFAGIDKAIHDTKWTEGALRVVILIGDAPGHEMGHPWNSSNKDAATLRQLANENQVFIYSIHIKEPQAAKFHATTEEQFATLATNQGVPMPNYSTVTAGQSAEFLTASKDIATAMVDALGQAKSGKMVKAEPTASPVKKQMAMMIRAAQVLWVGREGQAQAPNDLVAFCADRDLSNPDMPSLDVCMLLNKRQLNKLVQVMNKVIMANKQAQMSGKDLFTSLQMTLSKSGFDPDKVGQAENVAQTELLPEYLGALPYKSQLQSLSAEMWASMSADQQAQFIKNIEAKIQGFKDIHDKSDKWVMVNEGDDPNEWVYPVPLELMP